MKKLLIMLLLFAVVVDTTFCMNQVVQDQADIETGNYAGFDFSDMPMHEKGFVARVWHKISQNQREIIGLLMAAGFDLAAETCTAMAPESALVKDIAQGLGSVVGLGVVPITAQHSFRTRMITSFSIWFGGGLLYLLGGYNAAAFGMSLDMFMATILLQKFLSANGYGTPFLSAFKRLQPILQRAFAGGLLSAPPERAIASPHSENHK